MIERIVFFLKMVIKKSKFTQSILFLITNFIQDLFNLINFKNSNNGAIMITFDDGEESVYINAFPIMKSLDVVGNVAVITDKIGCNGYMTLK